MGSFYDSLLEADFPSIGGLYPVNPKIDEINGARCYPTLLDRATHLVGPIKKPYTQTHVTGTWSCVYGFGMVVSGVWG